MNEHGVAYTANLSDRAMGATYDQIIDWNPTAVLCNHFSGHGIDISRPETDEPMKFSRNVLFAHPEEVTIGNEMFDERFNLSHKALFPDQVYSESLDELKEGKILLVDHQFLAATSTDAVDRPVTRNLYDHPTSTTANFARLQNHFNESSEPTISTVVPIIRGKKGLCYDVNQVVDDRVRDRIIRNRQSAERSRKRKIDTARETLRLLEEEADRNRALSVANSALRRRLKALEAEFLALK